MAKDASTPPEPWIAHFEKAKRWLATKEMEVDESGTYFRCHQTTLVVWEKSIDELKRPDVNKLAEKVPIDGFQLVLFEIQEVMHNNY